MTSSREEETQAVEAGECHRSREEHGGGPRGMAQHPAQDTRQDRHRPDNAPEGDLVLDRR